MGAVCEAECGRTTGQAPCNRWRAEGLHCIALHDTSEYVMLFGYGDGCASPAWSLGEHNRTVDRLITAKHASVQDELVPVV